MTTFYTAFTNTRTALIERFEQLAPNRDSTLKFAGREPSAVAQTEIGETTGRVRLFEFEKMEFVRFEWMTFDTNAVSFNLPLVVTYPDTYEWRAAAFDDFSKIAHSLTASPLSVDGLALCVINPETGPQFQDVDQDDWFTMTVPLLVEIEESS